MPDSAGKFAGEALTKEIIEAIIKVHRTLGPGFLESIYQNALILELGARGLEAVCEREITIYYEQRPVGKHRLDLVVNDAVILELKAVETLSAAHYAQLRSYLRAAKIPTGLLVNFASAKADFRRLDMPLP